MESQIEPVSRDHLALVRTDLANERTLLAYGRTALMVTGSGVSLIKFFADSPILPAIGWALTVAGIVIGLVGTVRFVRLQKRLHRC